MTVRDLPLVREILTQAAGFRHLQESLIAGAVMEGGGLSGPWPPGDNGRSRGPYQIKTWQPDDPVFRGHPITPEQADDPAQAVAYALKYDYDPTHGVMAGLNYRGLAELHPSPTDVAFFAERPARYYTAEQQVRAWAAIAEVFGSGTVEQPVIHLVGAHPSNYEKGRGGLSLEAVVWHVTTGGMPGPWFHDPSSRASTHFAVSKTGHIEQYVDLADTAYAHGIVEVAYSDARKLLQENWGYNPNRWAVGIEFEGTVAEVQAGIVPTVAQAAVAAHLTAWLFDAVLFDPAANAKPDPSRDRILMHRDISPASRTCPVWGEAVQARMIAEVQAHLTPAPPPPPDPDPEPPDPSVCATVFTEVSTWLADDRKGADLRAARWQEIAAEISGWWQDDGAGAVMRGTRLSELENGHGATTES